MREHTWLHEHQRLAAVERLGNYIEYRWPNGTGQDIATFPPDDKFSPSFGLQAAAAEILHLAEEVEAWKAERGRLAAELAATSTDRDRLAEELEREKALLTHELTAGAAEIRRMSDEAERSDCELFAELGAVLDVKTPAAVLEPKLFPDIKPFGTSLGAEVLVAAFELRSDRDRLVAENARMRGMLGEFADGVPGSYKEAIKLANTFEASLKVARTEIAALKATLAEAQQAERWLAGVKWDARLSLLVADFRDRASILRGTTTWEQAYRQAAIDLEEVIEQMAKESPEPAKEPQGEAPKAEIIDLMEALKASLAVAPKRKE